MRQLEEQLLLHFRGQFRRVWVQRHARQVKNDVVITLFPRNMALNYRIISARNLDSICFTELVERIRSTGIV